MITSGLWGVPEMLNFLIFFFRILILILFLFLTLFMIIFWILFMLMSMLMFMLLMLMFMVVFMLMFMLVIVLMFMYIMIVLMMLPMLTMSVCSFGSPSFSRSFRRKSFKYFIDDLATHRHFLPPLLLLDHLSMMLQDPLLGSVPEVVGLGTVRKNQPVQHIR